MIAEEINALGHVMYSKACEKEIKRSMTSHHLSLDEDWLKFNNKYLEYLSQWKVDLGGAKNFHNGKGGTYDCIAMMTYYSIYKDVVTFSEIEEMEENLILPAFKKHKFVNCNKPFWKKIMYKAFTSAKKKCDRWHDYEMNVAPYQKDQPIYYEFTACPAAQFAKAFGLSEIMPALCNVDYKAMEMIKAKLVRQTTCANGEKCDYTICGSNDKYGALHPEYRDEAGYRRNK